VAAAAKPGAARPNLAWPRACTAAMGSRLDAARRRSRGARQSVGGARGPAPGSRGVRRRPAAPEILGWSLAAATEP
jgi:hypothetical protein